MEKVNIKTMCGTVVQFRFSICWLSVANVVARHVPELLEGNPLKRMLPFQEFNRHSTQKFGVSASDIEPSSSMRLPC